MANPSHLEIVRDGRNAIAEWRRVEPTVVPDLVGAELQGLDLSFAELEGADLRNANLTGSSLLGADLSRVRLNRANLTECDMTWVRLVEAHMHWANLTKADLFGADLSHTISNGADFTDASLISASLRGAKMIGSKLTHTDLTWTDMRDSQLVYAKIHRSTMRGTDVRGADLRDCGFHIVYGIHIQPGIANAETLWPEGFDAQGAFLDAATHPIDERVAAISIDPGNAAPEVIAQVPRTLETLQRTLGGSGLKMVRAEIPAPSMGIEQATLVAKASDQITGAMERFVSTTRRLNREWRVAWGPSSWGEKSATQQFRNMVERRRTIIEAMKTYERDNRRYEKVLYSLAQKRRQIPLSAEEEAHYSNCWETLYCRTAGEAERRLVEAARAVQMAGGRVDIGFRRFSSSGVRETSSGASQDDISRDDDE